MASTQYNKLRDEIYVKILERMEKSHEGGRFVPHGTAEEVLQPEVLRRFFRSLQLGDIPTTGYDDLDFDFDENNLTRKMGERKLHNFLAILIFASRSIEAARTFTTKLLAQRAWPPGICSLPAERETLTEIFGEQVTPDEFMTQQACFCPIVICDKTEVRVQSPDRQCLPYLEQKFRGDGAQGAVYQVKIAKGHFFDPVLGGRNEQPKEMARKDYQPTKHMEKETLKQILACDRTCPNIVDIYGSLVIGSTNNYSIFMPLAECDLNAYMREDHRRRPNTTMEKTQIINSARGLARGLEFLHSGMRTAEGDMMVCYHMDIKPKNILVFLENVRGRQETVWKISDFGMSSLKLRSHGKEKEKDFGGWFARSQQSGDASTSAAYNGRRDGTYLGPETLSKHRTVREKSDVWSLGCVLSVVFTYLEEGSSGVERYAMRRASHRSADNYDRFFVTNPLFGRPKINPAVTLWHDKLIKKARQRSSKEGEAVKSMLDYLVHTVLQPEQSKRCNAQQLEDKLLHTFRKYGKLGNEASPRLSEEAPSLARVLQRMHIDVLMRERQDPATDRRVGHWDLSTSAPFKGCEISPDGTVIAFWTDTKILLYTSQSLEQEGVDGIGPVAQYPIPTLGCRWKSISLTRRNLIASTSGGTVQCYIFKLGSNMGAILRPSVRVSLPTLPEIKKVALGPGSQRVACIVSNEDEDQNSGSLYFGYLNSPHEWKPRYKLDWPAADIVQLSFATDDDLYMVFRPQRSGPNHKHEIPVIHVSFRSNELCQLIIEPQGLDTSSTVGLFTTFTPFLQKPHVCVLVTREKQLHIRSLEQGDTRAAKVDIKNYRVLKLMMGKNDEKIFAVGRRAAHNTMLLLEIAVPTPREETSISVTELAEIPGLTYSDEFTERVVHSEEESVVILAALMGANQCRIYKITVPR